jgi:transposase
LGYTWALASQPAWRKSFCPPLSDTPWVRLNWYGAYDFSEGRCFIWHEGHCNSDHTINFLERLAAWLNESTRQVVLIWDGASYHRSNQVRTCAEQLGFQILPLPGYSPDLNPIEGLWKWLREVVTHHYCHETLAELRHDCLAFIDDINLEPEQIIARLWPRFDLDPELEKLRFSS